MRAVRGDLNRASRPTVQLEAGDDQHWRLEAACKDAIGDPFFDLAQGAHYTEARRWCGLCDVRDACLADVLDYEHGKAKGARFGFTGGTSPEQRWVLDGKPRPRAQEVVDE